MSLKIPQSHLDDPSKLTDYEKRHLQDRGKLPDGVEPPEPLETPEVAAKPSKATPLAEQTQPSIGRNGGIVEDEDDEDDEEEDYDEGWTNDQRRASLSARGLNIDGKKDEMIARLRRADLDQLTEEDQAPEED